MKKTHKTWLEEMQEYFEAREEDDILTKSNQPVSKDMRPGPLV